MKIQEISIGSIVSDGNEPRVVAAIIATITGTKLYSDASDCAICLVPKFLGKGSDSLSLKLCEPVEFDCDWAVKFGFKEPRKNYFRLRLNGVSYEYSKYGKKFYCSNLTPAHGAEGHSKPDFTWRKPSVHFIQNVIFITSSVFIVPDLV